MWLKTRSTIYQKSVLRRNSSQRGYDTVISTPPFTVQSYRFMATSVLNIKRYTTQSTVRGSFYHLTKNRAQIYGGFWLARAELLGGGGTQKRTFVDWAVRVGERLFIISEINRAIWFHKQAKTTQLILFDICVYLLFLFYVCATCLLNNLQQNHPQFNSV